MIDADADLAPVPRQQPSSPAVRRRIVVVANNSAGALMSATGGADNLTALCRDAGLDTEFIDAGMGTLPERIAHAATCACDAVVVAGGDGTVACAVQALAGTAVPLGILPFGTMNLLANDLGLPVGDTAAALRVIATGRTRAIDVGEVNGHAFCCASMLGAPTRLGRLREQGRKDGTKLALWVRLAMAGRRALTGRQRLRLSLLVGEQRIRLRTSSLTVSVNALAEDGQKMFRRDRLDAGELAAYHVERLSVPRLLRLLVSLRLGLWKAGGDLVERRGPRLRVETQGPAIRVMNDGEPLLLDTPLIYELRPKALLVLAPDAA